MLQGLLRPRPGISQSLPPHPIGQSKSHMGHPDSRGGEMMGRVAQVTGRGGIMGILAGILLPEALPRQQTFVP